MGGNGGDLHRQRDQFLQPYSVPVFESLCCLALFPLHLRKPSIAATACASAHPALKELLLAKP